MRLFPVFFIFPLLLICLLTPVHSDSAISPEADARTLMTDRGPEDALLFIDQILTAGYESPELYQVQAEAFFMLGEIDESLKSLAAYEILWRLKESRAQ